MNHWLKIIKIEKDWEKVKPDIVKESGEQIDIDMEFSAGLVLISGGTISYNNYISSEQSIRNCAFGFLDLFYRHKVLTAITGQDLDPLIFKKFLYSYKSHLLQFNLRNDEFDIDFQLNTPINLKDLEIQISEGITKIKSNAA